MDINKAIEFAQLVNAAYEIQPGNLVNSAGAKVTAGSRTYTVATTIYASDLATDMNPGRGADQVSIGLICQADGTGDVVIAIRGTEGILEWVHDAEFLLVPCPFLAGSGHTEDGFTAMYTSLRTDVAPGSSTVVQALAMLPFAQPATSLTICGHSLGGALATLLALDVAANTVFKYPTVYTYASPRAGDPAFASTYNQVVKNTCRIANRIDLVPKLPFPPLYEHVLTLSDLNPVRLFPFPPKILVRTDLGCEHALNTYLYLLSLNSGGPVLPLAAACGSLSRVALCVGREPDAYPAWGCPGRSAMAERMVGRPEHREIPCASRSDAGRSRGVIHDVAIAIGIQSRFQKPIPPRAPLERNGISFEWPGRSGRRPPFSLIGDEGRSRRSRAGGRAVRTP